MRKKYGLPLKPPPKPRFWGSPSRMLTVAHVVRNDAKSCLGFQLSGQNGTRERHAPRNLGRTLEPAPAHPKQAAAESTNIKPHLSRSRSDG